MTFSTDVSSGDPVKRVLVLFLGGSSGAWTPVELQQGAGNLWTGSAPTSASSVQYFVQAVDSHGNVAVSTNKGYYFAGAPAGTPDGLDHDRPERPPRPERRLQGPVAST